MSQPPKPRTEQAIRNAKIKAEVEGYYARFEDRRTTEAIKQAGLDFLTALAHILGVKPTKTAIKHSKKGKKKNGGGEENQENKEDDGQ